ncbi:MAG: chitobiase/beta-hexosaminidase C-terminal domain-containing protein, partial [Oscillospiraceae bacterium]
ITKEYTANTVLPFPEKATKLVVRAIAYEIGKTVSDEDYVEYSNDANLPLPYAPNLLVAGADHSDAATYPDASEIKFTHTNLAEGLVYFTVNSSVPSGSNANAYRYGKGQEYDETKPFRLPTIGGRDFIEVKAVFHSDKTLLDSPVGTYRVHTKQMLKAPAASIPTGKRVPPGQKLLLSLSNAAISQLNTTSKISAARITYSDGKDGKPATDDASFKVDATNPPVNGTEYISYNVDQNNETYSLPTIRYKLGAGAVDIDKTGAICQYGQRRVLSKTVNGVQTVTVSYINPEPIVLTGEADKAITVSAMALSELEAYSSSAVASFEYTIFAACAKPTAIPATTDTAFTMLAPGSFINLASATANTSIYYTVNNSMPVVQDYLDWVTNGSLPANKPATMLYDDTTAIVMPNKANAIFTIRTIVHSNDNTFVDSGVTQFTYQMPAQVNAVYVSPSQGSVVTGTTVQLKCATPDAKIFYRTFASKPDMAVPENIPKPYKDQIFDAASPLVITKNIWIVALAEKNGMTSIPTIYEYTIAPLTTEPTASLKTGSVVNRGTRIRLSGAGSIAFTMDGSDPKAAVAAMQTPSGGAKADAPAKAAEVFFGDSFVVDAEFGKSVTVRAFTYGDGKTPSNVVSFTYTVCEKDSYITAVPQNGSVVTSADQITLATTISDGKIFYSTGTDTPALVNRYADAAIDAAENEPYTHYQWIAGANTIQGTSLKISGTAGSTVTIKAVACANGSEGGATQVFTYKIRDKTAAPTASIPNGAVTLEGATVVLSAREGDIFFTTDGTKPSTSSRLYTEPIEVPGSMVLKAIAVAKDKTESDVVEYHYSYADQAFAPEMSIPSGEIEQGKLLTLTSKTENASIYYTTNGAEPTEKSTLYTAPINIMRPVTIKAIAIYKGLRNSAVNSASYTVIEPPPPQTENGADGKPQGPLNSLVSRRTYFDETVGPKFSAFVARDNATNTVISANDGIVPKGAKLVVKRIDTSDSDREAVRTALGNEVVVLYDVSLEKDGEKVEPSGEVELGITIPEEYQNSLVTVCRIGADNTVEEYEPRRSGTAAYFLVSGKLDRYAVTIPEELAASGGKLSTMSIVLLVLAMFVALLMGAGAVTFLIIRKRSRIAESDLPLEQEENFEDFFSDELHDTDNSQPTQNEDENNS